MNSNSNISSLADPSRQQVEDGTKRPNFNLQATQLQSGPPSSDAGSSSPPLSPAATPHTEVQVIFSSQAQKSVSFHFATGDAAQEGKPETNTVPLPPDTPQPISPTQSGTNSTSESRRILTKPPMQKAPPLEPPQKAKLYETGDRPAPEASIGLNSQPPDPPVESVTTQDEKQPETPAGTLTRGISGAVLDRSLSDAPFAARVENFAFAMRLQESNSTPARSQAPPEAVSIRTSTAIEPREKSQPAMVAEDGTPYKETNQPSERDSSHKFSGAEITPPKTENTSLLSADFRSPSAPLEPPETAAPDAALPTSHVQPAPPELPKSTATPEIHLHLTGSDQSSAAVRVTERGGAVSISVHSSDPLLRNSLRANLSELSGQLSSHGWKTDLKASSVAPHGASADGGAEGKNPSNQHSKFAQGERRGQRDRRGNSSHWQQEFEEQAANDGANRGGKN